MINRVETCHLKLYVEMGSCINSELSQNKKCSQFKICTSERVEEILQFCSKLIWPHPFFIPFQRWKFSYGTLLSMCSKLKRCQRNQYGSYAEIRQVVRNIDISPSRFTFHQIFCLITQWKNIQIIHVLKQFRISNLSVYVLSDSLVVVRFHEPYPIFISMKITDISRSIYFGPFIGIVKRITVRLKNVTLSVGHLSYVSLFK